VINLKKTTRVLLTILCIFVIILGAVAYWQHDNISAILNGMKYSSEELASQLDSNRENLEAKVDQYISSNIKDLSAEDEQKLLDGQITFEEISEKYNLPLDVMKDDNSQDPNTDTNEIPTEPDVNLDSSNGNDSKAIDKAISTGVSKMYALKAKYVSKLGEIERNVYEEYTNLPKEKQNESSKKSILMKNLNYVAEMEQKCDDEVANTLSELESDLIELKGDTEIIKILRDAYKNEKEIKKSYYLSLYND